MAFEPKKHLTNLRGKDYLETKWRIVWFKEDHPHGRIITRVLQSDPPLVRATIYTDDGFVLATGHGTAQAKAGAVWAGRELEKAETAAIGRALGHAGYGTQFTDEDELDNLADSPVAAQNGKQAATPPQRQQNAPARPAESQNAAPNASPSSTPNGKQDGGASAKWTEDDLYDKTHDYFNAVAHFDHHFEKHKDMYANLSLQEAAAFVRQLHWNYDKAQCDKLKAFGMNTLAMTANEILAALAEANGHNVKGWKDWDGGNYTVAQGALLAWNGGYSHEGITNAGLNMGIAEGVIDAALDVGAQYMRKHGQTEVTA